MLLVLERGGTFLERAIARTLLGSLNRLKAYQT